jgi:CheY-like chemotaxis protein
MTELSELRHLTPKMLIADDDPAVLRLLAGRCARAGFQVETAANGIQALIKANRTHPDILIIDVNMPEADGLTICARLLDPAKKPMDVVVITGSREPETIERCDGFGAFYVRKGADFWTGLTAALTDTFPQMATQIKKLGGAPAGAAAKTRPRVLVIDDDPLIEKFLTSRFAKLGVEIIYASNAPNGVRVALKEEPSVIISDYSMPDGDAHYLLAKLRTTPLTANIPVVVLTGLKLPDMTTETLKREVCGHPGATEVFSKSHHTDELFAALRKLVGFEGAP